MNPRHQELASRIAARFGSRLKPVDSRCGELTYEVAREDLSGVCMVLRDDADFRFDTLIDVCGIDYLTYGRGEWQTDEATSTGFSRAASFSDLVPAVDERFDARRFAVVYHLLSVSCNYRLRLRTYTGPDNPPMVPSLVPLWQSADWFEREAFDLYGILFDGHPDLRRILTDYGFIGNPFRKDFPISGNVEVRYDPDKKRVVYQPVSIEPRTLVPRVIRDDNRYEADLRDGDKRG